MNRIRTCRKQISAKLRTADIFALSSKGAVIKFASGSENERSQALISYNLWHSNLVPRSLFSASLSHWNRDPGNEVGDIHEVKAMFCHNKPLFRARSEGLGRLAHSVYCPLSFAAFSLQVQQYLLKIRLSQSLSSSCIIGKHQYKWYVYTMLLIAHFLYFSPHYFRSRPLFRFSYRLRPIRIIFSPN